MGGTTQDNSIHIRLVRRVSNIPSPLFIASPDFSPPLEMRKQGTPVNFADFYGNSELFPDVIVPKDTWGDLYFWDYRLASVELDNGTIFTPAYERSYIHSVGPKYKYNLSDLTASGAIVKLVFERG